MKFTYKLFDFMGSAVNLRLWFLLLLAFVPVADFFAIFIAVLIHELAHVYVAKKLNYRVGSVNIDLFYGSAETGIISNHKDNILISAAGPISNLILMTVAFLIKMVLPIGIFHTFMDAMVNINCILFIFNIIPIFPMDGGRISKSVLSMLFGNMKGAFYNGILSLVLSVIMFLVSVTCGLVVLAIFSLLFAYISYKEIETNRF